MAQAGPPIICCCDPNSLEIADPAAVCGKSKFSLAASREELFKPTARLSAKERGGACVFELQCHTGAGTSTNDLRDDRPLRETQMEGHLSCHSHAFSLGCPVLSCLCPGYSHQRPTKLASSHNHSGSHGVRLASPLRPRKNVNLLSAPHYVHR